MTDGTKDFTEIHNLISEGKYTEAESVYKDLLNGNPEHLGLREGLGKLYLTMGEKEKAEQYLGADYVDSGDDAFIMGEFRKITEMIDSESPKRDIIKKYEELAKAFPEHAGIKEGLKKYLDATR